MARFLDYASLTTRQLPRREDVERLAARISQLPPFRDGNAVVCGSVCWGSHTWSSDIDVAHFSTEDYPRLDPSIRSVTEAFRTDVGGQRKVAALRVEVVVIGAEVSVSSAPSQSLSAMALSAAAEQATPAARMFADVAVRFADHIGAIAAMRGDPWRAFYRRHLASVAAEEDLRIEGIRSFVSTVSDSWAGKPLDKSERDEHGHFTRHQLDLLSQVANYPFNLMRRMLGELSAYPAPDRISDIRTAFEARTEPWARAIHSTLPRFDALSSAYNEMAHQIQDEPATIRADAYYARLAARADELPIQDIQEAVWSYIRARG